MGSSCSSGQGHKDKDSTSSRSEDGMGSFRDCKMARHGLVGSRSPSYQANARKDSRGDAGRPQQQQGNHSGAGPAHSGVVLEAATAGASARPLRAETATGGVGLATPSLITIERKPMKVLRSVATSSVSADSISLSSPPGTAVQSPRDFDKLSSDAPPLPQEVQQLPDNLRSLLLGQVAAARVGAKTRKIVVYVCAADSQDCCVEKGALHNTVYPGLRAHCRDNGYELHVVDLHWKTGLEKQQDHEFPELCLGELARQMEVAYVLPVLFLSNSLGTPLLPGTIESQDFEMAVEKAEDAQLLRKWYQLDAHAQPPCYRLQPISSHIPGFKESSPEEKERALREWRSEIERTLAVMVSVFPQELRDTYLTTVVEQEVHNTVFMSQELARRCVWLCRVFTPAGTAPEQPSVGEAELSRRLEALQKDLRNQLSDKHILRLAVRCVGGGLDPDLPEHAQYVSEVAAHMARHLRACVDAIIEEDQSKAVLRPSYGIDGRLFEELMQQTSFCQRAAQCSINREAVLHSIRSYVAGEARAPLVLHGPRGCGKSTLVARAAQCCHAWQPECVLLLRAVGVTARSSTAQGVLRSLLDQCCVLARGRLCWDVHNMESYRTALSRLLAELCLQRPTLIVIDNIDQVREYGTQSVDWLPAALPENAKLILSVAQDSPVFAELKQKIPSATFVEMPSLGKAEAEAILMSSVMQYNHSVSSHVQDCVRASVQDCTLPLYVKVLAWQTSWWSGREHGVVPRGNVTDQLRLMLDELESILGKERVEHALALAAASKNGLCDSEMLDLLAHDERFHSKDTYVSWAPSCLFWAGLNKYLAPFMRWSGVAGPSTLRWRDALLLEVIRAKYDRQHAAASVLADYYQGNLGKTGGPELAGRLLPQPNKTGKCYNQRKLEELPYQMFQLHRSIKDNFLFDQSWLFDKLCGAGVYDVLEDIFLEEAADPQRRDAELALLRGCLEQSAGALHYDGRQFYSQMHVRLSELFAGPGAAPEHGFLAALLRACRDPPVPSLVPAGPPDEPDEDEDELVRPRFDAVTRLGDGSDFVATVSTEREEISVWDARSATRVRTLVGVTHPINLKPVDERRCVVLCRRELRVYDLDAGRFVARLKGVMNQKMPYYGLHDAEHLVALSRNRMYVNLMHMGSGDCVTTFKAGEDRFLNSLLVSGDGRVLVCGDETQKPFPLLVWNLASRKLLYDLRIPHHDFITNLAAITFEGHYVCCVAKEVDEPSPNFIVVYDLQSGTLFKKWKPGVSTVSLDISSRDGCVISGLEDARILVWDLVTGNCRWSLSGHTAPVDFLRLDPQGGCVLSADSCCRDRSLRLWDLSKGELLAVHTPDRPATSREVMCGGRVVVLALRGRPAITSLRLLGPGLGPAAPRTPRCYGRPENTGRTFHLRDDAPPER